MEQGEDTAVREVELSPGRSLKIKEYTLLQDEAGAVVWDAGLVLAHYLAHQQALGRDVLAGSVCLELGSGTGVVGLAAASLGAAQVYLSDLPHLVPYLRENIQANSLGANCSALCLDWGSQQHLAAARAVLLRPPDVILASDVVYTPATRSSLFATFSALMASTSPPGQEEWSSSRGPGAEPEVGHTAGTSGEPGPGPVSEAPVTLSHVGPMGEAGPPGGATLVLLSYEDRPGVEELPALCAQHGLEAREVPRSELHPDWLCAEIHVLQLRKKP